MRVPLTLLAVMVSMTVRADLLSSWEAAQVADPSYRIQQAERDLQQEERALALAELLPQISATASLGRADSLVENQLGSRDISYDTEGWAVQLRQPVIRSASWAALRGSGHAARSADARLQAARQELARRLIETSARLCAVQLAVTVGEEMVREQETLWRHVQKQVAAGELTRKELTRVLATLGESRAAVKQARVDLARAGAEWRQITGGQEVPQLALPALPDWRWPALEGMASETGASAQSSALLAEREAVLAARRDVDRQRAMHLPTVDLVAARTYTDSETENLIGSAYDTTRVGVQLTLPLTNGGATMAQVRRARARLALAEARLAERQSQLDLTLARERAVQDAALADLEKADAMATAATVARRQSDLGLTAGTSTRSEQAEARIASLKASQLRHEARLAGLVSWVRWQEAQGAMDEVVLKQVADLTGW